jgi:hypothetical protein
VSLFIHLNSELISQQAKAESGLVVVGMERSKSQTGMVVVRYVVRVGYVYELVSAISPPCTSKDQH